MPIAGSTSSGTYSYSQLRQLWINAGGSRAWSYIMAAIAMAESGGNPLARHVDANNSVDYGLWQINTVHGYSVQDMLNPQQNAREAVSVFNSSGPHAWSTFNNGAYKKYMPNGKGIPASGPTAQQFLTKVQSEIGQPYIWGGTGGKGFDCSGLVYASLRTIGINTVPRTSEEQWGWVKRVSKPQAGDLVFMNFPGEQSPGHVMVYEGGDKVIQAPSAGQKVQEDTFKPLPAGSSEWGGKIVGYGQVPGLDYSGTPSQGGGLGVGSVVGDITGFAINPVTGVWDAITGGGGGVVSDVFGGLTAGIKSLVYQGLFIAIGVGLIMVGLGILTWTLMGKTGISAPGVVGVIQTQQRIGQSGARIQESQRASMVRESQADRRLEEQAKSRELRAERLKGYEQNRRNKEYKTTRS